MNKDNLLQIIWFAATVLIIIRWLKNTNYAQKAFQNAPDRTHLLRGVDVIAVVMCYIIAALILARFESGEGENADWHVRNRFYLVLMAGQAATAIAAMIVAHNRFNEKLAGFGLRQIPTPKTFALGVAYFFVGMGLASTILLVVVYICGKLGYEHVEQHMVLEALTERPPVASLVLLLIGPAITAPLLEEILFRGILQSYFVRLFTKNVAIAPSPTSDAAGRWAGIIIASAIFAVFHHWQHAPALFALSVCLGYCYERYGSLWIPIIAHSLFNILPMTLAILKPTVTQ